MHDLRLEDQLRTTLRGEGDMLPLTITSDELERRLLLRRRERAARRMTLVAAGVATVAIGAIFAASSGLLTPPNVAVDPSPGPVSPTTRPEVTATPSALDGIEGSPDGTVVVAVEPTSSGAGITRRFTVEGSRTTVARLWVACEGPGSGPVEFDSGADVGSAACPALEGPLSWDMRVSDLDQVVAVTLPADVTYAILLETVPLPTSLPELGELGAPAQVEGASDNITPNWDDMRGEISVNLGTVQPAFTFVAEYACLGPGDLSIEFRVPGSPASDPPMMGTSSACADVSQLTSHSVGYEGPLDVVVTADARAAWKVAATSIGLEVRFYPPTLTMTSWFDDLAIDPDGWSGALACGHSWDLGTGESGTDTSCDQPAWPPLGDEPVMAVPGGGQVHIDLPAGWTILDPVVSVARYGESTPSGGEPSDLQEIASIAAGSAGRIVPVDDLALGRWTMRVRLGATDGTDRFDAAYFFVIEVGG